MKLLPFLRAFLLTLLLFLLSSITINAQTTAFSYQGRLTDNSSPASGTYEMQFTLHSTASGNLDQVGPTITNSNVQVTSGVFSIELDFGSHFPGADRWLEISVKKHSESSYTTISPRVKLNSVPYAVRALSVAAADSLSAACAGCIADSHINSISASKVTGSVANAANAVTATNATTAATATTANAVSTSASDSVVTAINAGSSTINAARLPSTFAIQNGTNTFSGANTFSTAPTFNAGLSAGSQRVTNLATPIASTDAANKSYVDSAVANGSFVQFSPSSPQTTNNITFPLADLKMTATGELQTIGDPTKLETNALFRLGASGTYSGTARDWTLFRVDTAGSILGLGEPGIGVVPIEGGGTRFMWFPGKAAIRAGRVDGAQWDNASIGDYSAAFGYDVRASNNYGFASGFKTTASGIGSTVMGMHSQASGIASVALGYYANTNGKHGTFVFSDRSLLDNGNSTNYEDFSAQFNNSFVVRAVGGIHLFTNTGTTGDTSTVGAVSTTGLRLSGPSALGSGGTASDLLRHGSFVWSDRSSNIAVNPTAQNQTIFRTSGGFTIYTNSDLSSGVYVSAGSGTWNSVSDRNMKENIKAVNSRDILRGVLALPISTWNYKTQDASIRHIGAMAQDFKAAFKVGEDDKHISAIDPDGVALAAIQGLNEELKDRDKKIEQQQQQINKQQQQIDALIKLVCLQNTKADVCKQEK